MTGEVTKVLRDRGFAFVRGEDQLSRFAHRRAFADPNDFDRLQEKDSVAFKPVEDERGKDNKLRAINVVVVRKANT